MPRISEALINQVFTTLDSLNREEYVVVHYKIEPAGGISLDEASATIAINTSLSTMFPMSFEKEEDRIKSSAKVISTSSIGQFGYIQIAYPIDLCGLNEGLPQLLTTIWYASEFLDTKCFWVENIDFPEHYISRFTGPKFGISGIRERIGITGRPLLGTIMKPRRGCPLKEVVKACYESLIGGIDIVMDDELIVDGLGEYSFRNRIPKMVEMVSAARARTSQRKWYVANITASPKRALEYAMFAIAAGVDALLVNAYTMGYSAFGDLAASSEISVPLINSGMGAGILTKPSQDTGTADLVLSKFSRMSGADAVYTGTVDTGLWFTKEILRPTQMALQRPFYGLRSSMLVGAGGLNIANLWPTIATLGPDSIVFAGSGIIGYPLGPEKAGKAFRMLVENIPYDTSREDADKRILTLAKKNSFIRDGLKYYGYKPT